MVTKDHILAEIRRTAINGRALGRQRFEAETGIKQSDWLGRFWTKWNDALREAGCKPNRMQERLPDAHLLQSLATVTRELGKFPTLADLKMKARSDPGFPSHTTFDRLGRKADRARKLVEFCASQEGLQDVADLAAPFAAVSPPAEPVADDGKADTNGVVYLMKSGKYYKIGYSVSAEKRAHELKLLLPEKLKVIHQIRTGNK